jgi:hypothetical protein
VSDKSIIEWVIILISDDFFNCLSHNIYHRIGTEFTDCLLLYLLICRYRTF